MNINEDKFANKSAEEIVNDVLIQHKNNSEEAFNYIQDILKDDGLSLNTDIQSNLKKAADILSDKGLKEGWFSKPKPKESVVFEVYLPFKKEPAQFQIPPVSSLDDPLVKETIAKIRKRHPHSDIYIRSKLGYKRITEEKKDKNSHGFLKSILSSDLVKNLAATGLAGLTGISPVITKPVANGTLQGIKSKLENTSNNYKINLYNESGVYTCYTGTLPIALTLIENASNNYKKADVLYNENIICSYNHALKEWTINDKKENVLKEDIYTPDDVTDHAYVDLKKDIANIDERTRLILCYLNPSLIDKRKPKWHNTLLSTPKKVSVENSESDIKEEVFITLDGIANEINKENPDKTELTIIERVPVKYIDKGTSKSLLYKNGETYVITVGQFKKILTDEKNAEILEKFENSKDSAILNDDQASYFLELDNLAKQAIDAKYPEWENSHMDIYNLGIYDLPERTKIYQAWKDLNRTNMYQQARELTPEEVNKQFGLPKLKNILMNQKAGEKIINAFNTVRKVLPESEQTKLDEELLDLITDRDTVEDTDIIKIIGYYGAKNQLNQLSKNKLNTIENNLDPEIKAKFEDELKILLKNKYVDAKSGLPKVAKNIKDALNDTNNIIKKYQSQTTASKWNNEVTISKDIVSIINTIKSKINTIKTEHPKVAENLMNKLRGNINNWRNNNITGKDLTNNLNSFSNEMDDWINDFDDKYNSVKAEYEKLSATSGYEDVALTKAKNELDRLNNPSQIKFGTEKNHDAWLRMVKAIENEESKSETDKSYWTAITNKISRLVKNDPQAATGYGNAFRKLIDNLEAKKASENEVKQALDKFLATIKDETQAPGTITKALTDMI